MGLPPRHRRPHRLDEILEGPGARSGSILVIDDEEINRDLLTRRLTHQGHAVFTADPGETGLALAARECIDLILLDVLMPGLSGYEVLSRIKTDAALRDIPVLDDLGARSDSQRDPVHRTRRGRLSDQAVRSPGASRPGEQLSQEEVGPRFRAGVPPRRRARSRRLRSPSRRETSRPRAWMLSASGPIRWGTWLASSNAWGLKWPLVNAACGRGRAARHRHDEERKAAQVAEITESDYFQKLKARAKAWPPAKPPAISPRADSTSSRRRAMAKIVSIHSYRGGTGKSNLTANLAAASRRPASASASSTPTSSRPAFICCSGSKTRADLRTPQRLPVGALPDRGGGDDVTPPSVGRRAGASG